MPDYRYTAQTKNGKQVKGRIKASDEREIRKLVSAKDQTLLYYEEIAKQIALKPLKKSQLSDFCRQMGELIKSGISILRALEWKNFIPHFLRFSFTCSERRKAPETLIPPH